jgi:hypothetical protein
MGREYFAVKNFERYQRFKDRRPPWVKLYACILDDPAFLRLSEVDRNRYMTLLIVASQQENRIELDGNYLKMVMKLTEIPDLSPLFRAGFLITCKRKYVSRRDREETEKRQKKKEVYQPQAVKNLVHNLASKMKMQ